MYQAHWHRMPVFALPSFYDGRLRVNLAGREAKGIVRRADYEKTLDRLEALLNECTDSVTGEPVVKEFERYDGDPMQLHETQGDFTVIWRAANPGFDHPRLGRIGPLPLRRTGGHTGPSGIAYYANTALATGDHGKVSAFDVTPTVISLLGEQVPASMSGRSLLQEAAVRTT
jgi:predicted AlkP superfamily phosphohydrolase/phosphomutase